METLTLEMPIYTYDIDYNQHVSNIVYVQWMEICRLRLLEAVGLPVQELRVQGFFPALVETHIAYKRALYFGETVRAECWLSMLSRVSCWIEFRFYNGAGELAATGRQKGVFVNAETVRPARLSEEHRARFSRYLQEDNPDGNADLTPPARLN